MYFPGKGGSWKKLIFPQRSIQALFMWVGRGAELFWDNYFIFLKSRPGASEFPVTAHSILKKKKIDERLQLFPGSGHTACAALHCKFILEKTELLGQNKIRGPQFKLCHSFLLHLPFYPSHTSSCFVNYHLAKRFSWSVCPEQAGWGISALSPGSAEASLLPGEGENTTGTISDHWAEF